jgi:hypothetical protein
MIMNIIMSEPKSICINKKYYYEATKLAKYDKKFFKGCSRIRTLLKKRRFKNCTFIYGRIKDKK